MEGREMEPRAVDTAYRDLLISQLQNANAARIAEAQTVWTGFALFGGASFVLFTTIAGNLRREWRWSVIAIVLSFAGALLLQRILAHLQKHEQLILRLEAALGLRADHRLTGTPREGWRVRETLPWLAWLAFGIWLGVFLSGFGLRLPR
jgi:hypothetical protein